MAEQKTEAKRGSKKPEQPTKPYEFALAAAEMAANTRCENVVVLDLRGRSPVTEFFIIATGTSPRQMKTVADDLQELGERMGFRAWQSSGYESARWILVDFVHVVAHVFDTESRDYYDLELLWGDSPRIDWRAELGLPPAPVPEGRADVSVHDRMAIDAGQDIEDAEEEEARLEGREEESEGDADVDEEVDMDSPVVVELPDMSTGSNSVEFVEIDPPSKRRSRGRAVFPTTLEEQEDADDEAGLKPVSRASRDEDEAQRRSERARDEDVEDVSAEDLPEEKIRTRPMGGVSAAMSSTEIVEDDEDQQLGSHEIRDVTQDHKDERPPAHEAAAEAVTIRKGDDGEDLDITTEQASQRPVRKKLKNRKGMAAPTQAAPGTMDVSRAKAGVVKGRAKSPAKPAGKVTVRPKAAPPPRGKAALKNAKTVAARSAAPKRKAAAKATARATSTKTARARTKAAKPARKTAAKGAAARGSRKAPAARKKR